MGKAFTLRHKYCQRSFRMSSTRWTAVVNKMDGREQFTLQFRRHCSTTDYKRTSSQLSQPRYITLPQLGHLNPSSFPRKSLIGEVVSSVSPCRLGWCVPCKISYTICRAMATFGILPTTPPAGRASPLTIGDRASASTSGGIIIS